MKDSPQDTPPSSVNGEEIPSMEEEMHIFEEVEEIEFEDDGETETDMEAESFRVNENHGESDTEMSETEAANFRVHGHRFAVYDESFFRKDHATRVFKEHVGSVFCCNFHPDGKLAATGGVDDIAYVWSTETGHVVNKVTGHKDSVIFVGFSFDGAYLATADMAGHIQVLKVSTEENQQEPWPVAFEYDTDDISWGQWHFGTRVLVIGVDKGDIYVFKIPSGDVKVLKGHNSKVECGKIFPDGVHLVVGYEDGAVKVWDLKTNAVINQIPAWIHQSRISAVDTHPDGSLVASIAMSGQVILTTSNTGKIVGQLEANRGALETFAFSQDPPGYFAVGTLDGAVSIWDVAQRIMRHTRITAGVTKMIWVKDHLLTGLLDGSVEVSECLSGKKLRYFSGHCNTILDLCYNAKQNILMTASDDGTARIYKYEIEDPDAVADDDDAAADDDDDSSDDDTGDVLLFTDP